MRRREFITLLGGASVWPLAARAQQPILPIIGILSPLSATTAAQNIQAFRLGMRNLGYSEGRDITFELRFADGAVARLPELAAELVAFKPAAIVAGSAPAALAVRNLTHTIPVVMNTNQDPMAIGLAMGMARPGGNVTGVWIEGDEALIGLIGKRLELHKEAVPGASQVAAMLNPDDPTDADAFKAFPAAASALGLSARLFAVRAAAEFEAAFAAASRANLQGMHVSHAPLFTNARTTITALAALSRIPAVYGFREFAVEGGLMSYASSLPDVYRQQARMVDKILKGATPAELPIERTTKFELVINLKTAKGLALEIPPSLLARADEVIE
jgi:putative tryptophan/tyrosine transport system substrate-binding protein